MNEAAVQAGDAQVWHRHNDSTSWDFKPAYVNSIRTGEKKRKPESVFRGRHVLLTSTEKYSAALTGGDTYEKVSRTRLGVYNGMADKCKCAVVLFSVIMCMIIIRKKKVN